MKLKDQAWNLKHRPNKVLDVVSEHSVKISKYLETPNSIPNLLLHSSTGGTGKTSVILALVKELGCDVLHLNGSADRSIDTVRGKITDFVRSNATNGKRKCVICEESEKISVDAAHALKVIIEKYSSLYIFTTNNLKKINQPLQSRFQIMEFSKPSKDGIYKYLENICKIENVEYTEQGIKTLIDLHYPSIRTCVNTLQDLSILSKKVIPENLTTGDDEYKELWKEIEAKKYNAILQKCHQNLIVPQDFVSWCFRYMLEFEDTIKKIKIIQILRDMSYDLSMGVDENPAFMSHIGRIMMIFAKKKTEE